MTFPASKSVPLPTAAERLAQLNAASSTVPHPPPRATLEEISKKLDAIFTYEEAPRSDVDPFLIDPEGFIDVCKYTYETIVTKKRNASTLSCHEFTLVMIWYLYKRLNTLQTSAGFSNVPYSMFDEIGNDILPYPVFQYLQNLGPIIQPTGKLALPGLPPPSLLGHPGLLIELENEFGRFARILSSTQIHFLIDYIQRFHEHRGNKEQAFRIGAVVLPRECKTFIHSWEFPIPVPQRNLQDVSSDFVPGPYSIYGWNPSILQSYRAFSNESKDAYLFDSYQNISEMKGSVAQFGIFEKDAIHGLPSYVFRSSVPMTAQDVTIAILFRYRQVYTAAANPSLDGEWDACARYAPRPMSAPFGTKIFNRIELFSQLRDFCSFFVK